MDSDGNYVPASLGECVSIELAKRGLGLVHTMDLSVEYWKAIDAPGSNAGKLFRAAPPHHVGIESPILYSLIDRGDSQSFAILDNRKFPAEILWGIGNYKDAYSIEGTQKPIHISAVPEAVSNALNLFTIKQLYGSEGFSLEKVAKNVLVEQLGLTPLSMPNSVENLAHTTGVLLQDKSFFAYTNLMVAAQNVYPSSESFILSPRDSNLNLRLLKIKHYLDTGEIHMDALEGPSKPITAPEVKGVIQSAIGTYRAVLTVIDREKDGPIR